MSVENPKLTDFILAQVLTNIVNGDRAFEIVKQTAKLLDDNLDSRFKAKSEDLQESIVCSILLPLCGELMKENIQVYKGILFKKWKEISVTPISK